LENYEKLRDLGKNNYNLEVLRILSDGSLEKRDGFSREIV